MEVFRTEIEHLLQQGCVHLRVQMGVSSHDSLVAQREERAHKGMDVGVQDPWVVVSFSLHHRHLYLKVSLMDGSC